MNNFMFLMHFVQAATYTFPKSTSYIRPCTTTNVFGCLHLAVCGFSWISIYGIPVGPISVISCALLLTIRRSCCSRVTNTPASLTVLL